MEEQAIQSKKYKITDRRQEGLNYYISFFVWPFGVLLAALRHWDRPWSKNVFWIFCIFFGYTFIIGKLVSDDAARHATVFIEYARSDLSLRELWSSFYSESSNYVDIASPLISYLVSRITNNPSILFAVFGLIFGYFYSRNIWYVLGQMKGKITGIVVLYILTFALFIPIWVIGNFRMWAAAQIFLFGALPYLLEGNSKRLFWSGVSFLFHFSFLFPLVVLFLFIFLKNRLNIYFVFFIVTAFIKEIDLQWVGSALSFLPDIFDSKISAYTSPVYAELELIDDQSYNWYIVYSNVGIRWVTYTFVLFVYFFSRKILNGFPNLTTLFNFSLLFYGCANIFSLVPSGGRFLILACTFMFAFFIIFMTSLPKIRGSLLLEVLTIPPLLLFCVVKLRGGMDYYGFMTIIGNPIIASFNIDTYPLITGIKQLIF